MDQKMEKSMREKMDAMAERMTEEKWPIRGGLIVKKSHCCGAPVVLRGKGLRRYVCSQCGKLFHEKVYR